MSFLNVENKTYVIFGVANKKSVAYHIGKKLQSEGAQVVYVVRSEERRQQVEKLLLGSPLFVCDVEYEEQINSTSFS